MTFYEIVLEEYINTNKKFLCDGSKTFRKNWKSLNIIKLHAEKFLREKKLQHLIVGGCVLFSVRDFLTIKLNHRQIRIDFLNWAIENNLDL